MAVEREITSSPAPRPDGANQPAGNSPVRRKGSLLDMKTDLKSLKYSFFGSNPAVVKDINDPPNYNAASIQVERRIDDLVRISKFVASGRGVKFTAKQGLLSQVNQNRDGDLKDRLKASVKAGAISAATSLASILAQVPVAGSGLHFIRGFGGYSYLTPGVPASAAGGLLGAVQNFTNNKLGLGLGEGVNGASIALAGGQIILDYEGGDNFTPQAPDELLDKVKDEGAKFNPTFADNNRVDEETYLGNSRSLGKTNIKSGRNVLQDQRANTSNPRFIPGEREDDQSSSLNSKVNTSSSGRLVNSDLSPLKRDLPSKATSADSDKEKGNTEIVNFLDRPNTRTNPKQRPQKRDYSPGSEDRLQVRANMGNPGGREDRSDITKRAQNTVDEVNELSIRTSAYDYENFGTLDIIPFEIEVVSPDVRENRYSTNNYLYFRAHLDSFSDDFTGNWNETKYVGRAEPMYTYDGFNRSVSFAFKIAAFTRSELLPLYQKLNFLASSTAPTYNGTGAFMRGTFSRLTIGDYLSKTPGFFNKIGISWEVGYPWEINLEDDKELPKVPHILNVDCGFTPVHNFIPALNQPFLMKDTFYANG